MKTAIVILNWNGQKLLEQFLPSVVNFSSELADIYIADNASTDSSIKYIKEFYPSISEQVVLFPLLEKELSEIEYELLKPNLNKAFLIHNENSSSILKSIPVNNLFKEFFKINCFLRPNSRKNFSEIFSNSTEIFFSKF